MPTRPKHPCRHAGCRALASGGYCPTHAPIHTRPAWESTQTSSHARGYGRVWQRLRVMILNRDPICMVCQRCPSTAVDHIRPKARGGGDDESNLQGICETCHTAKTNREKNLRKS